MREAFPLRCQRNGGVTRIAYVDRYVVDGTEARQYDACDFADGSAACVECRASMQRLLNGNPSASLSDLARFHAANQTL